MKKEVEFAVTGDYLRDFASSIAEEIEFHGAPCEINGTGLINVNTLIPAKLVCLWDISFLELLKRDKGVQAILTTRAIFEKIRDEVASYFIVLVRNPEIFWKLHNALAEEKKKLMAARKSGFVPASCTIAKSAIVDPHVIMGENCHISDHVVIKDGVVLGNNVVIKSGAVIAEGGFEIRLIDGRSVEMAHERNVVMEDNVIIGANTVISKGIYGLDTVIKENAAIDACVHIAHGTLVGRQVRITAGVIIGGACVIEDNVYIGIGSSIKNNVRIGKSSFISMGANVTSDVPPDSKVIGFPGRIFPLS